MEQNNKTKPKKNKVTRVSKSGRVIKTPKAVMTTSSDEPSPRQRSSKTVVSVRSQLQRLREVAKNINAKKKSVSGTEQTATVIAEESYKNVSAESASITTKVVEANPKKAKECRSTEVEPRCSKSETPIPQKTTESAAKVSNPTCLAKKAKECRFTEVERRCTESERPIPEKTTESAAKVSHPTCFELKTTILGDYEENFEECSTVNFEQVLDNLKKIQDQNEKIEQQNEEMKEQNKEIINQQKRIIDELAHRSVAEEMTEKLYEPLEGFPLKTIEDFERIDSVSNRNIRKKLYRHLCNLGGTKVREFLNCAMKETMTDELVNSFTWPGGKSSEKFGDTKIANVLYLSAKKCPQFRGPDNKSEFKAEMLEVLRTTKQRFRKLSKKSQVPEPEEFSEPQQNLLQEIRQLENLIANQSSEDEDVDEDVESEENFDADVDTDGEVDTEEDLEVDDNKND